MKMLILTATLLIPAPATSSVPDQTNDARLVLKFVDAVKRGSIREAETMLRYGAFIGSYDQRKPTAFAEFASYAKECQLQHIILVTGVGGIRMPIGVKWFCPYPQNERDASFWFEGNSISRIGWGKPPVIKPSPVKTR
jgi:hypothetical protein